MPLYNNQSNYSHHLNACLLVTSNYTATSGDVILADISDDSWTLTLPNSPNVGSKIDIYLINNLSDKFLFINLNNSKFKGDLPNGLGFSGLKLNKKNSFVSLIYSGTDQGWIDYPQNHLVKSPNYISGMRLWLDGSGLLDLSGYSNNASIMSKPPLQTFGLDNQPVLHWDGSSTQELKINPFLSGTSAATLYIVFSLNDSRHYNLIRTFNAGDYWHFNNDHNGYFGVFRNARFEAYPTQMPSSGSHLASIHVDNLGYEVLIDNISKGVRSGNFYVAGDRFRIGSNDFPFFGDIATLLVYPFFIDKLSTAHLQIVSAIKSLYPSLSI